MPRFAAIFKQKVLLFNFSTCADFWSQSLQYNIENITHDSELKSNYNRDSRPFVATEPPLPSPITFFRHGDFIIPYNNETLAWFNYRISWFVKFTCASQWCATASETFSLLIFWSKWQLWQQQQQPPPQQVLFALECFDLKASAWLALSQCLTTSQQHQLKPKIVARH